MKRKVTWQRVKTPATPMLLIEGNYIEERSNPALSTEPVITSITGTMPIPGAASPNGTVVWKEPHPGWDEIVGADIRLRYHFETDKREAARAAAEKWANAFTTAGAVNVKLDPVKVPTTRARIPELGAAVRFEDKLALYWKSINFSISDERRGDLLQMLHTLQEEAAADGVAAGIGKGVPTIKSVYLKNFFKFPGENRINLLELEGPLTTIIAPNETGKTLLMQLMGPGVLYGKTPTRGTLDDLARGTDSVIEIVFDMDDAEYVLSQSCNGKDRKGHVNLLKNKVTVLGKNAGRAEYRKWALKNLLPESVYEAVICQSGTKNLFLLGDAERTDVLMKVLGLELYEALAGRARQKASAVESLLKTNRARIEEIGDAQADVTIWTAAVKQGSETVATEEQKLTSGERDLAATRQRAAEIEEQRRAYSAAVARFEQIESQVEREESTLVRRQVELQAVDDILKDRQVVSQAIESESRLQVTLATAEGALREAEADLNSKRLVHLKVGSEIGSVEHQCSSRLQRIRALDERKAGAQQSLESYLQVVADADSIREALVQEQSARLSLSTLERKMYEQQLGLGAIRGSISESRALLAGHDQRMSELGRRAFSARSLVAEKEKVLSQVEQHSVIQQELQEHNDRAEEIERRLARSRSSVAELIVTRITGLRGGLQAIADGSAALPAQHAASTLRDDDTTAETIDPAIVDTIEGELRGVRFTIATLTLKRESLDAAVRRLPLIEEAERIVTELSEEKEQCTAARGVTAGQIEVLQAEETTAVRAISDISTQVEKINNQIGSLAETVNRVGALNEAEAQIAALRSQIKNLEADASDEARALVPLESQGEDLRQQCDLAQLGVDTAAEEVRSATLVVEGIKRDIAVLAPVLAKSSLMSAAEARREGALKDISHQEQELQKLTEERDKAHRDTMATTNPDPINVAAYESGVDQMRQAVKDAEFELRLAEKQLSTAEDRTKRLLALQGKVHTDEQGLSNWVLLAQHMGKDGLQKEEVSFAGPELTSITNDLLRSVGDLRHTVSIETERLHSNKKDIIPTFDIIIYDSEEDEKKESRLLSDAGMDLVGEPLRLALIELGCRRAGVHAPTIFRDEATGKMDVVNAPRYIGMLRRFADQLEARVLYVGQQPAVQDLADSKIFIESGKVRALG